MIPVGQDGRPRKIGGCQVLDTLRMSGPQFLSDFTMFVLGSPQEQCLAGFLGPKESTKGGKNKSAIAVGSKRGGTWKDSGRLINL